MTEPVDMPRAEVREGQGVSMQEKRPRGFVWQYLAKIRRVVDSDTLDLEIDLGYMQYAVKRIRLKGVHAPDKRQAGTDPDDIAKVRRFVDMWLATQPQHRLFNYPLVVLTEEDKTPQPTGDGSAGRWIGIVYPLSYAEDQVSLNQNIADFMHANNIRPGW